jgi:L-lactate dehydrogenase complex protein LldG
MSDARAVTLARIRDAIGRRAASRAADYAQVERRYRQESQRSRTELIDLFASRIEHYDGQVLRCGGSDVPTAVSHAVRSRGKGRLHRPVDLDAAWLPDTIAFLPDQDLAFADLESSEGVLTGCTVAIATTGTIVLTHGPGEGRRALTLVPDYHLAIVYGHQIVDTVPEGLARAAAQGSGLLTTISGPSATADIEMTRIKGVHGPRTLDVIVVD